MCSHVIVPYAQASAVSGLRNELIVIVAFTVMCSLSIIMGTKRSRASFADFGCRFRLVSDLPSVSERQAAARYANVIVSDSACSGFCGGLIWPMLSIIVTEVRCRVLHLELTLVCAADVVVDARFGHGAADGRQLAR